MNHTHHDYWLLNEFKRDLTQKFEDHLKTYLIQNLSKHGVHFNSDDEFIDFFKRNVYRITHVDRPNDYQFYANNINGNKKGIFIGAYSTEVTIEHEANKITATIGKTFKSMIAENRNHK